MSDITPSPNGNGEAEQTIGNQFLSNIPEEDREIVGRYIGDWDKGVTQKFQEIHNSYNWVKDFGTQEEIQAFKGLYDWVDNDPKTFYEQLGKALAESDPSFQSVPSQEPEPQTQQPPVPDQFTEQFSKYGTQLEGALKWIADQQAAAKAAEEDAALNNYLQDLHKQHGDFDEDYVVAKMYRGMQADKAIEAYQALVQGVTNQAASNQASIPPFLSSGSVPATAVNPSKLSRNEAREMFNAMFEAAQRQNQ